LAQANEENERGRLREESAEQRAHLDKRKFAGEPARMLQPVFESGYVFPEVERNCVQFRRACEMVAPVFNTRSLAGTVRAADVIPVTSNGAGIQRSASDKSGTSSAQNADQWSCGYRRDPMIAPLLQDRFRTVLATDDGQGRQPGDLLTPSSRGHERTA